MPPHVVILGGGFGGLAAARGLARADARVTIVDRTNHHLFQPLLYQVATAGLAPSDIAEPIRSILSRQANAAVRLAEVTGIDLDGHTVQLSEGGGDDVLAFDRLVIAMGVRHSYFGHAAWEAHAPGLKTLSDALEIRRRVLMAFERAEWTEDPAARRALTTFVVIGGGPTGVELAGALAEIARRTLQRDYRFVDTTAARILLLEGSPAVLQGYGDVLQGKAADQLRSLGVTVRLGAMVTGVDASGVDLGDERIDAATVLWAAGVQGAPIARTLGVPLDRAGRVRVEADLSVPGHPDVFVVGDLAHAVDPESGQAVPGVAPAATQMGAFVARTIRDDAPQRPRPGFRYVDRGAMATIGRSRAIAKIGRLRMAGVSAWLMWVVVHIWFLIRFRNRLIVMTKFAFAWLTFDRATRLLWRTEAEELRQNPDRA